MHPSYLWLRRILIYFLTVVFQSGNYRPQLSSKSKEYQNMKKSLENGWMPSKFLFQREFHFFLTRLTSRYKRSVCTVIQFKRRNCPQQMGGNQIYCPRRSTSMLDSGGEVVGESRYTICRNCLLWCILPQTQPLDRRREMKNLWIW